MPSLTTTPARARSAIAAALLALAVALGAGVVGPVPQASAAGRTQMKKAVHIALAQLGDPYRYGAAGPDAFDCSGLMYYAFRHAGVSVPRTAAAQAGHARRIPRSKLRMGDLMFFTDGRGVYHMGMFLSWDHGKALMLDAPHSGTVVRREHPWTNSWFAATLRG